jgi:hypothetical protein
MTGERDDRADARERAVHEREALADRRERELDRCGRDQGLPDSSAGDRFRDKLSSSREALERTKVAVALSLALLDSTGGSAAARPREE